MTSESTTETTRSGKRLSDGRATDASGSGREASATARPTPNRSSRRYEITALLLGFGGNFFAGMFSTLMATYLPDSVEDLLGTLDEARIGYIGSWIGSLYLVGWAIGGISFGWFGDRFGRAASLSASILLIALSSLGAAWSPGWQILVLFRFLSGIGVGATMVLCAVFVAEVWGKKVRVRALILSLLAIGFPIGIIASGAVTWLIPDWRSAFLTGVFPLLLSLACWLLLREPEQWKSLGGSAGSRESSAGSDGSVPSDGSNRERSGSEKGSLSVLFSDEHRSDFIIGAVIFGTMSIGIWSTFSWLPTWAHSLTGMGAGQQEGSILIMLLGMGGIAGCLAAGFLANTLGRKRTLMLSFAGAGAASALLYLTNSEFSSIIYLHTSLLSLFFGFAQGILMIYIPELFPVQIRSTATGICFNAGRLVTAASVFFVGILVPVLGGYGNALMVFSLTYLVGFAASLFGKETKNRVL